jgi:hypothetical protein
MTRGVADTAIFFVLSYIAGPLAGFDSVVQHPANFIMPMSHTFQFPLYLAAMLHLTDYTSPPLINSFVFVPFPTNVYICPRKTGPDSKLLVPLGKVDSLSSAADRLLS